MQKAIHRFYSIACSDVQVDRNKELLCFSHPPLAYKYMNEVNMIPIEKISITDTVVDNLKELIKSGQIPIDEKLPTQKEICEQLNVGRSTVREAFRVLQAMGLVKMKPGKGAFVAKITDDDQDSIADWFDENKLQNSDFMEVREALESLAIKLAIKKGRKKDIQEIETIQNDFIAAFEAGDPSKLALYDEAFHNSIIKATHNQLLIAIHQKVSDAFKVYRLKSFAVTKFAGNAIAPHNEILSALKEKNIEKGVKATANHIKRSLEDVSKVMKKSK